MQNPTRNPSARNFWWATVNAYNHFGDSIMNKEIRVSKGECQRRIWIYKMNNPCKDCGEEDPVVLEFDHIKGNKLANISKMLDRFPWKEIIRELKKCDVVCANCHRRRTAAPLYYSHKYNKTHKRQRKYKKSENILCKDGLIPIIEYYQKFPDRAPSSDISYLYDE